MSCAIGPVDRLLHSCGAIVAVLVRVPVAERDVLGRDFNKARAGLDQPPREQAAQSESARVVRVVAFSSARATDRTPSTRATAAAGAHYPSTRSRTRADNRCLSPDWARCISFL